MKDSEQTIQEFVARRNAEKKLFTAGPASLLEENINGLMPCFGRGDDDYLQVEDEVLTRLKQMSGHEYIARMQGSASLALEIMSLNFLHGRVLVVESGYYSERLHSMAESAGRRVAAIKQIDTVDWESLEDVQGQYDWILSCYTETSVAIRLPIKGLKRLADKVGARLMLDATASIGLEPGHELADVIAYSSCKGLFGLTGAAFIAFNEAASIEPDSFYLDIRTHLNKGMTGPYHAIASLHQVLAQHEPFRQAVINNKQRFLQQMSASLSQPEQFQPLLCTHVFQTITKADPDAVLYTPRSSLPGSVVCHIGEVHLGDKARGNILEALEFSS